MRHSHFLLVLVGLCILAPQTSAQVVTGTPPFGSFGGGPDVINLANLNSHLTVPTVHKPGRGLPFAYDLQYDSSVWYPVGASGSQAWVPAVSSWGWTGQLQGAAAVTGFVTYQWRQGACNLGTRYDPSWYYYDIYIFMYFYDQFGRRHDLFYTYVDDNGGTCPNDRYPWSKTIALGDGSGYTVYIDATPTATVYPSKGGSITPPLQTGGGGGTVTDANGNQITEGSGVFTDTLGTTPMTITGSGSPSSPVLFTYTAPSGGNVSYTMKYTAYTVLTNFNCSGISEYTGSNISLPSEIDLPDGTKYTLTYETTPGDSHSPHYVTGRIASIGLPTGGSITYVYSGGGTGVNGINCADGSAATVTRTTPDGTWTYAQVKGTGAASTTTVTDPLGNNTVIQFQGIYETQRQVYQGAISSANLLKTVSICYNGNTTNCTTTAVTIPITQRNITDQLAGTSNLTAQHIYKYNSNGSLIEQDDYDYGSGSPGPLLKKTAITFASLGTITASRQQVTVTNGAGTVVSQTNYNYDETAVVSTSGTPQHFGVSGSRGNLTSINYYTNGSTYLTERMTYFDTGKVQTITDLNGAQTTYTYGACGNSFPTSISEPLSLSRSLTWNCTGGVQLTSVDENNQITTTAYGDPYFWRPASVTDPTNAVDYLTYTGQTQTESVLTFNSGNSADDTLGNLDGLGRTHVVQKRQTPSGTNFDTVELDYDAVGRPARQTLPYTGTAGQTNSSAPGTSTSYDALSRVTSVSDSGGGTLSHAYSQNDELVTRSPAPTGENTKRRQYEYDGLGRLTSVCEITSATGSGSCGQNTSQTGYWTKYTYNALGKITGVTQNAQSSGSTQSRSYVYDLLGRITSETNAENSTTSYVYDTDSTCGTSSGDLVKKTDAVGNVSCTAYDALHRPTAFSYPSGSYASKTPTKKFVYDSATVNSIAMTNVKGRIAEAYTCTGTCTSKITDEGFSYTVRGEPSDIYESTPSSGGYYHIPQTFWPNGALNTLSNNIATLPLFTYGADGEGRPSSVSVGQGYGQNPVTNTTFNTASLPTSVTYGSSDSDSFTYDSNTNRLTQYKFVVNGQSFLGALTWSANHSLQQLQITDPFNSADNQTCVFAYDDLKRVQAANCGSAAAQTFSYDPFGNISKSGSPYSFQPTYSSSTNQFATLPGFTPSYDANGNDLADGSHTYSWDSTGKAVSVDSVNLTFDALGRMVEQNRSGTYTQIVYSPGGAKLALMSGQTLQKAFIPLPGGGQAVYNSSGLLYYGHSDHLGSIRLGSTPSRTMYFSMAYAPFGETYATAGSTDPAFTGQRQDTVGGLYDFPARQYSTQGRWPSPDPSGLSSVSLFDPQTWNRYAYVRNSPLGMLDSSGLCGEDVAKNHHNTDQEETSSLGPSANSADGYSYSEQDPSVPCVDEGGGGGGGGGGGDAGAGGADTGNGTDPGNGDPTSGGDQNNGGSDCSESDANCGGAIPGTDSTGPDCEPLANMPCPGDPNTNNPNASNQNNPTGTCVYLNAAGTGISPSEGATGGGIDSSSNQQECSANGGAFFSGVTMTSDWRISVNPDTGVVNVRQSSNWCSQAGYAVAGGTAALTGAAAAANKVPGVNIVLRLGAALSAGLGAATLLQVCGTGVNSQLSSW